MGCQLSPPHEAKTENKQIGETKTKKHCLAREIRKANNQSSQQQEQRQSVLENVISG